jgi:hypothetical protein
MNNAISLTTLAILLSTQSMAEKLKASAAGQQFCMLCRAG